MATARRVTRSEQQQRRWWGSSAARGRLLAAALAVLGTMLLTLGGCTTLMFAAANVPAAFGDHELLRDLAYGPRSRHRLDVYVPEAVPAGGVPVIVFWHGGGWIDGDRERYRFVGATLADAGYVVMVPDYRLHPEVRFPAFVQDAALALKWAHDNAARFGGDPAKLFVMGHSAGAHQAALLALDPRYLEAIGGEPHWIRGLIGLSGPYALVPDTDLLRAIFGPPHTPADWQAVAHVTTDAPPVLLGHGDEDGVVWIRHSEALETALRAAGVDVTLRRYARRNHADTVAALSVPARARAPVLADIKAFVARISASPAPADR
jgi:acetyl esterase/lipase